MPDNKKLNVNKIKVYDMECKSLPQLYYNVAKKINEIIEALDGYENEMTKELNEYCDKLDYALTQGYVDEVARLVSEMADNGLLDDVLTNEVFPEVAEARTKSDGTTYESLKARLDDMDDEFYKLLTNANSFVQEGDVDFTDAIVRALDSKPDGGIVYILPGSYKIRPDIIKLKSNTHIVGIGHPVLYTDMGEPYVYMMGNHDIDLLDNITIEGIAFDQREEVGKFAPTTNLQPTRAISLINASNVKVKDCVFNNFMGQHCVIINQDSNGKAENIIIEDNVMNIRRVGYPTNTDFYDQSAIYVESDGHIIKNNMISAIDTGYQWWEVPGGIETHGSKGVVENNVINNAMIGINVTPHWWKVNKTGKRIINNNNLNGCGEGIMLWSSADETLGGNGINNIDIVNNYIGLKTTRNVVFGCGIGTTYDDNGIIDNLQIKCNTIEYTGNVNHFTGTNVLSAVDISAIKLRNKGKMTNVVIEGNTIKNYGGCVLGITSAGDTIHERITFKNNTIVNCTYYKPYTIWSVSMMSFNNVNNIEIMENKFVWDDSVSYPSEYGASHLFIDSNVTNLEYKDNKYYYNNYFNIMVNMSDYRNRTSINIDFDYMRQERDWEFKMVPCKNTNFTSGNFVTGDVALNLNYESAVTKLYAFTCGTYGTSSGVCDVLDAQTFNLTTSNKFSHDTFISCDSNIAAVITKNGSKYFVKGTLTPGYGLNINYNTPAWS